MIKAKLLTTLLIFSTIIIVSSINENVFAAPCNKNDELILGFTDVTCAQDKVSGIVEITNCTSSTVLTNPQLSFTAIVAGNNISSETKNIAINKPIPGGQAAKFQVSFNQNISASDYIAQFGITNPIDLGLYNHRINNIIDTCQYDSNPPCSPVGECESAGGCGTSQICLSSGCTTLTPIEFQNSCATVNTLMAGLGDICTPNPDNCEAGCSCIFWQQNEYRCSNNLVGAGATSCADTSLPPVNRPSYNGPLIEYGALIKTLFTFLLPIAIGVFGLPLLAINGYKIMTSKGDPAKYQDGIEGLVSAIIGLIFVLLAISLLRILVGSFLGLNILA